MIIIDIVEKPNHLYNSDKFYLLDFFVYDNLNDLLVFILYNQEWLLVIQHESMTYFTCDT